jgi:hypothetical protein
VLRVVRLISSATPVVHIASLLGLRVRGAVARPLPARQGRPDLAEQMESEAANYGEHCLDVMAGVRRQTSR